MAEGEFTVPESLHGARLDKAAVELAGLSRARARRAIEGGAVRVNGRILAKGAVVSTGDVLSVAPGHLGGAEFTAIAEPEAELTVRFESPSVLVVDKPARQACAPLRAEETGTLANALAGKYPELASVGYSPREPGLVHRLDTDTSGLVVVARTAEAFEALRQALKDERLVKEYELVCASEDLPDEGTIEYPIANHPKDQRRVYPCIHPRDVARYAPRPATTHFRVVRRVGVWALVQVRVSRALRHQIRAHFAAISHPLAGDHLYGGAEIRSLGRHALHASRVAFDGGNRSDFAFDVTSPLPPEMTALVEPAA